MNIKQLVEEIYDSIIEYRRDMHMYPEASMEEYRTTKRISEELSKLGVQHTIMNPSGVIANIQGLAGNSKHIVLLRADIDGLSIEEKTDLEYKSRNIGFMHACGHDTHNAMLLGAVKVINAIKDQFDGTVRFVFQPGEEVGLGAKAMIEQGVLEGVDYCFGMHISSTLKAHTISGVSGTLYAATDWFKAKIIGKTAHGADPVNGIDATVAGSAVVLALQQMVSREYPPYEQVVVTVGKMTSGSRFNIISGECNIEGTCRMFSQDIHKDIDKVMERIIVNTAKAYRCEAKLEYNKLLEAVVNNEEAYMIGKEAALKVTDTYEIFEPSMGGEDFGWYTTGNAKCAFFTLGAKVENKPFYPMHHECVEFDESSLATGIAFYVQLALDSLKKLG